MKLLLDMNISPLWCAALARHGHEAVHWSVVGDPRATDQTIMDWARAHGRVVVTHDLDFGALLAATRAEGPSVVQIRTQDMLPNSTEDILVQTLRQFADQLEQGALIIVDHSRTRARILPLAARPPRE